MPIIKPSYPESYNIYTPTFFCCISYAILQILLSLLLNVTILDVLLPSLTSLAQEADTRPTVSHRPWRPWQY